MGSKAAHRVQGGSLTFGKPTKQTFGRHGPAERQVRILAAHQPISAEVDMRSPMSEQKSDACTEAAEL